MHVACRRAFEQTRSGQMTHTRRWDAGDAFAWPIAAMMRVRASIAVRMILLARQRDEVLVCARAANRARVFEA